MVDALAQNVNFFLIPNSKGNSSHFILTSLFPEFKMTIHITQKENLITFHY